MATIKAIEGKTVSAKCSNSIDRVLMITGPSNPIRPSHRRFMLRSQGAGREQSRCRSDEHWYNPSHQATEHCSVYANIVLTDVRFKNQGLDAIEVQDNGDGISPHNYETLALKHHTSKLSTYADLTTLQTFGFRGEALSSLCALSKFSVVTCMQKDTPKGTKLEFEVSGKMKGTSVVAAQKGTTVAVENLFNNLPVRRRELERNIKREWTRVVGVLGQYACIQTGIKFSVNQQAGKGKKTTLFSTKGNQSTRENIVNVFGAKTLTALIALDLNLELEATSAPSQRWGGTQDDGGDKSIRIVGHISRPASGEGRQTPDRQMFFVNARPCGLPQVAKAFNEVYKAYNGTQSPFIFANIELDTHLYDVNVSPDKRTILLHDQNRMLETLKEELTKLFESQDYTVPISQLPQQKQPGYKQLTISRENSGAPRTSQTPAASDVGEASEDGGSSRKELNVDDAGRSSRGRSTDADTPSKPFEPAFRRGAVSRESISRDREAVNLVSKWAGRKAEDRVENGEQAPKPAPRCAPESVVGLSEEKRRLVEKLRKEGELARAAPRASEEPDSSVATSQSTNTPVASTRPPIPGFDGSSSQQSSIDSAADGEPSSAQSELPIPVLQSPPKPTPSIADRFSSTARSQRPPTEIATITIGDHTVTSTIGSPAKRARVEHVHTVSANNRAAQAAKHKLPTFGSSLSQMFGAPGTARQPAAADEIEDGSDAESVDGATLHRPGSVVQEEDVEDEESHEAAGDNKHARDRVVKEEQVEEGVESSLLAPNIADDDAEYIPEEEKKALEDAKVQEMIQQAEEAAHQPTQDSVQRTKTMLKGGSKKKDATLNFVRDVETHTARIKQQQQALHVALSAYQAVVADKVEDEALDSERAEEKLSLTISKSDFAKMKIIGQFNLGFILAARSSEAKSDDGLTTADDMFIIDQHASDEKYNFERLQATTIVQSQRLVYPKVLDLTAMEEEIVMENLSALETNGFIVTIDESGTSPVGQRCSLVSLPLSRETAFSLTDLEELIALLAEHPPSASGTGVNAVPRPSKVRKMFAMRACRSSIMIGKTLTKRQMGKVVGHLGELDKPWNCPHGRPTMRHLCGLGEWDRVGWKEGTDMLDGGGEERGETNWAAYVREKRGGEVEADDGEAGGQDVSDDEEEQTQDIEPLPEEDLSEDDDEDTREADASSPDAVGHDENH